MRLVLDTSVIVSGFIARRPESPPRILLEALHAGAFISVASPRLASEWREVATRPRVLRAIGRSAEETLAAVGAIETLSTIITPPRTPIAAPDPDDAHLWDILDADREAVLVTGDGALLANPPSAGRVIAPLDAVGRLREAGRLVRAAP